MTELERGIALGVKGAHELEVRPLLTRISELESIIAAQVDFTERLRKAANAAVAHASHINQNFCGDVPADRLAAWAEAQTIFNVLSITPSPAQAFSTVARDGAAVN